MKNFFQHHWLGNVRELENVIQRLIVLGNEKMIIDELSQNKKKKNDTNGKKTDSTKKARPSLKEIHRGAMTKAEADVILKTLERVNWNRKKAAELLNISYKALLYKIKEYGLNKKFDLITS